MKLHLSSVYYYLGFILTKLNVVYVGLMSLKPKVIHVYYLPITKYIIYDEMTDDIVPRI